MRFLEMLPEICERQNIPRGGMVTKGVAPALRATGPPFQFARLNGNLDVACRLYNDVRWREGLPRPLVVKDDQGGSNSFLHVFGDRNSFWRLARGCKAATRKGRERRQGECRKLRWWGHRALHRLSCVVYSESYLGVLVPLARFP